MICEYPKSYICDKEDKYQEIIYIIIRELSVSLSVCLPVTQYYNKMYL